jgi:hypothetical protein
MTSVFPEDIDNFTNPTPTTLLNQPGFSHAALHGKVNDAIENIEEKVGVRFSDNTTSLDYITNLLLATCFQHPNGYYREIEGTVFPQKITWFADNTKTIKLLEKQFSYDPIKKLCPTTIEVRLYSGTISNSLVRTFVDYITYDRVFETSRERIVI